MCEVLVYHMKVITSILESGYEIDRKVLLIFEPGKGLIENAVNISRELLH